MRVKAPTVAQPKWFIVIALVIIGAFLFFKPFLGIIAFSALMAYLFIDPYRWFAKRMKPGLAAMLTTIISLAVVVIPITIIVILAIVQGLSAADSLSDSAVNTSDDFISSLTPTINAVNDALAGFNNGEDVVSTTDIQTFIKETVPQLMKALINIIIGIAGSITTLMSAVIIYGYLVSTLLINHKSIRKMLKDLSPFDDKTSELYLLRAGSTARGSLKGQLLIAVILGVTTALTLFLIGYGPYFFFMTIILTLLSMVPLGTGVVVIPLAIIAMIQGQFWPAVWVLIIYLLVICNIDNFLRPRLIPKDARLNSAVIVLATFSGLFYFGLLGIVYGPLIAVMLVTSLEVYHDYRRNIAGKPATS